MVRTPWIVFLGVCALALYVGLGAANLYLGDLNQDEGWYLYAARQVHEGRMPYRDFAFTQGPMLPLVYSLAQPWVDRWGVAGGRLFTALLGLAGALGAAWLGGRAVPRNARPTAILLAFILIAGNVYQSCFTTVVKTYPLCALFLVSGLVALSFAARRGGGLACFAGGALLALAAGTRVSAGIALPVAGIYLLLLRRKLGNSRWLSFGVGGAAGLAAISIPFLGAARAGFLFALFEYHSGRSAGGLVPLLVFKAGFISRLVQAYFFPLCLGAAVVLLRWLRRADPDQARPEPAVPHFRALLWAVTLAITFVHFAAPFPYEDYQVAVFPVFAAALAAAAVSNLKSEISNRWALGLLLFALIGSTASAFSSPINQGWVIRGRDRIWWKMKEQPQLQRLQEVASWIGEQMGMGSVLLTQDTYLAVEAGLLVPEGLEMGPFSYFPDMSRERATRLHLLNRAMLTELLNTTDAPIAAFSGYGLSIRAPEVAEIPPDEQAMLWDIVTRRYEELCSVTNFGQAFTTLRILRRKPALEKLKP